MTNQARKPFSNRFGSPGLFNKQKKESEEPNSGIKFMGEMKKHGIISALDDMNKFSEFFEKKPSSKERELQEPDSQKEKKSGSLQKFTESQSTQMASSNEFINSKYKHIMKSEKVEHHKARFGSVDKDKESQFLFPFQRRARSHSPPSENQIKGKIVETINHIREKERSWSKSAENNKPIPVVANTSFMIGGVDLGRSKKKPGQKTKYILNPEEKRMMETKEVEEWLADNTSPE